MIKFVRISFFLILLNLCTHESNVTSKEVMNQKKYNLRNGSTTGNLSLQRKNSDLNSEDIGGSKKEGKDSQNENLSITKGEEDGTTDSEGPLEGDPGKNGIKGDTDPSNDISSKSGTASIQEGPKGDADSTSVETTAEVEVPATDVSTKDVKSPMVNGEHTVDGGPKAVENSPPGGDNKGGTSERREDDKASATDNDGRTNEPKEAITSPPTGDSQQSSPREDEHQDMNEGNTIPMSTVIGVEKRTGDGFTEETAITTQPGNIVNQNDPVEHGKKSAESVDVNSHTVQLSDKGADTHNSNALPDAPDNGDASRQKITTSVDGDQQNDEENNNILKDVTDENKKQEENKEELVLEEKVEEQDDEVDNEQSVQEVTEMEVHLKDEDLQDNEDEDEDEEEVEGRKSEETDKEVEENESAEEEKDAKKGEKGKEERNKVPPNDTKAHESLMGDYKDANNAKKTADSLVKGLINLLDDNMEVDDTVKSLLKEIELFFLKNLNTKELLS
ncbi:conserved Plasmodium protein, unknown function [Plasmodium malariae]|uniref:Merozoite surface protein 3 n=1 Tax=Plasmodium malariae TaxID=5858 RepID=A0A1A8X7B2_PLAMA|nr:conserved Plasmodium protein, unknown function [Plasmodium malariae]